MWHQCKSENLDEINNLQIIITDLADLTISVLFLANVFFYLSTDLTPNGPKTKDILMMAIYQQGSVDQMYISFLFNIFR